MCRDWIKQGLLNEKSIEKYEYDYASQQKFNKDHQLKYSSSYNVYANIITILLSILVLIIGGFYDVDTNAIVLIIVILVIGGFILCIARTEVRKESARRDVPAICSKCQNTMYCYRYTDNKGSDMNGIVYLCHDCNTKFIYSKPCSHGL